MCYNNYGERERKAQSQKSNSEVHKMKMRFYENDFERMFDEAVEELEREAQMCEQWEEEEANRFF